MRYYSVLNVLLLIKLIQMYRTFTYNQRKQEQLLKLLTKGQIQLFMALSPNTNTQLIAAILRGKANDLTQQLANKKIKNKYDHLMLIIVKILTQQDHQQALKNYKNAFPLQDLSVIMPICDQIQALSNRTLTKGPKKTVRHNYQQLIGKSNLYNYMNLPGVPVFLISTLWLQKIYTLDEHHPPPIDNKCLIQPSEYPLADQQYLHYNYAVKDTAREKGDFQIVPYQAWKYLHNIYGGLQVRRYVSEQQKNRSIQVWLDKITITVTQQRCIFKVITVLASKFQTVTSFLKRVMRIIQVYGIVPSKSIKKAHSFYKVDNLTIQEVKQRLHNDDQCLSKQYFSKIEDHNILISDLSLNSSKTSLILNFHTTSSSIFSELKPLALLRSLSSKDDQKQSKSSLADQIKIDKLVQFYKALQRVFEKPRVLFPGNPVGLQNLGNTCYMNSAIQCLLRMQKLTQYFLSNHHLQQLNVSNVLGSKGTLACVYGEFVKDYFLTNSKAIAPSSIMGILRGINAQFRGYNHQDSQQFLSYFLDKLHEDLNRIKAKPIIEDVQSDGRPDQVISSINWQNYLKRNSSKVSDLFAGQYKSQIKCPDCNRVSITFDPFMSITLQFPRPQNQMLIQGFFMTDIGQFQKVSFKAPSKMLASQFSRKYLGCQTVGVWQKEKKIVQRWNPKVSLFQNQGQKIAFWYAMPKDPSIQVVVEFCQSGSRQLQHFSRILFAQKLESTYELKKAILNILLKPLKKSLSADLTQDEIIQHCIQRDFIKLLSVVDNKNKEVVFPIAITQITAKVQLLMQKLKLIQSLKLNSSSSTMKSPIQSSINKSSSFLSVQQMLDCFSEPQQLTQDNTWYCRQCKDHKQAQKIMQIYKLPQYVIIHLKRFNLRGHRSRLYGQKVNIPLMLTPIQKIKGQNYELSGVVDHFGSLLYGHYTAQVKRDKQWKVFDDSKHRNQTLSGQNAYLLFYRKIM